MNQEIHWLDSWIKRSTFSIQLYSYSALTIVAAVTQQFTQHIRWNTNNNTNNKPPNYFSPFPHTLLFEVGVDERGVIQSLLLPGDQRFHDHSMHDLTHVCYKQYLKVNKSLLAFARESHYHIQNTCHKMLTFSLENRKLCKKYWNMQLIETVCTFIHSVHFRGHSLMYPKSLYSTPTILRHVLQGQILKTYITCSLGPQPQ